MFDLTYISKWGETLDLAHNPLFWLTNVDGMTNAATDISANVIGGQDGDDINNIQAQPRPIILDLLVDYSQNVEDVKRSILRIIKLKQPCVLRWVQNNRTWEINGVVDGITMPRFSNSVTMQVSIHCEDPYWHDIHDTISEIAESIGMQYFTDTPGDMLYFPDGGIPFGEVNTSRTRSMLNDGDVSVGMIIEIVALKTVTNPIIYNAAGDFIGIGHTNNIVRKLVMSAGDVLVINTNTGEKSVTLNGVSQLDKIKPHSTWLQLEAGENELTVNSDDAETDNLVFTVTYRQKYI